MGKINLLLKDTKLWCRKNSPQILLASGLVCSAASIVLACRATSKIDAEYKEKKEEIKSIKNDEKLIVSEKKHEISQIRNELAPKLVKAYLPAGLLFVGSVAAIFGSYKIERGRELAAAAAYTSLKEMFDSYKSKVENKIGEDEEKKIDTAVKEEQNKKVSEVHQCQDFTFLWDEASNDWCNDANENLEYLLIKEKMINDQFRRNHKMLLSDVLKSIGIDPNTLNDRQKIMAYTMGWVYEPDNEKRQNYISFGLSDTEGNLTQAAFYMKKYNEKNIYITLIPDVNLMSMSDAKLFAKNMRAW